MSPQDPNVPPAFGQVPQAPQMPGALQSTLPAQLGAIQQSYGQAAGQLKKGLADIQSAGQDESKAVQAATAAENAQNHALMPVYQDIQAYKQQAAQQRAELAQAAQAETSQRLQQIDRMTKQYSQDAQSQGDFWANKSVGSKVGWAVALALGGFGAAMTKSQNGAMQLLETAMKDDAQQKDRRLAAQRGAIGDMRNSLQDFRQMGLDQQKAQDANDMSVMQAFQARLESALAQTKDPIIQANGQKSLADVRAKIAEKAAGLHEKIAAEAMEKANKITSTLAADDHLKLMRDEIDYKLAVSKLAGNTMHVPGFSPTTNKKDNADLRTKWQTVRGEQRIISDLKDLMGTTATDPKTGKAVFVPRSGLGNLANDPTMLSTYTRLQQLISGYNLGGIKEISNRTPTEVELKQIAERGGIPANKEGNVDWTTALRMFSMPGAATKFFERMEAATEDRKSDAFDFAAATGQHPLTPNPFDDAELRKLDPSIYIPARGKNK